MSSSDAERRRAALSSCGSLAAGSRGLGGQPRARHNSATTARPETTRRRAGASPRSVAPFRDAVVIRPRSLSARAATHGPKQWSRFIPERPGYLFVCLLRSGRSGRPGARASRTVPRGYGVYFAPRARRRRRRSHPRAARRIPRAERPAPLWVRVPYFMTVASCLLSAQCHSVLSETECPLARRVERPYRRRAPPAVSARDPRHPQYRTQALLSAAGRSAVRRPLLHYRTVCALRIR